MVGSSRVVLQSGQQLVEPVEALGPELAVARQPLGRVAQRLGPEVAEPDGRLAAARDQPGLLEHLEVPRDGGLGHRERRGELGDAGLSALEPREDRAAGRIGERTEDCVELLVGHNKIIL